MEIDYFIAGQDKKANMATSAKATWELHNKHSDVFTGTWCIKGTFSLQVKEGAKPYQAQPRCMAYSLQDPLTKNWKDYENKK